MENHHDDVRKVLYDTGFTFKDGRTAMDMTDEEVEQFVVEFIRRMGEMAQHMTKAMEKLGMEIRNALIPLSKLARVLAENDGEAHGA